MNYQSQFDAVFAVWPLPPKSTWITVQRSLIATLLGLIVAVFCGWGETSAPGWLRFIVNACIEVIRNTPFLVQLFFFFALPAIGLRWSPDTAALTAMVLNLGAHATEIIRADGKIVEQAPPTEFFGNPQNEKTRQFLGQILWSHQAH